MQLPKIDVASLPSLGAGDGIFGSLAASGATGSDDTLLILMTYLYEIMPPSALI